MGTLFYLVIDPRILKNGIILIKAEKVFDKIKH